MSRRPLGLLLAGALLAACGGGEGGGAQAPAGERSDRLVDFSKPAPYVNALDIDPADGDFLLTTNRGFYRIDAETERVETVRGTVTAAGKSSPVGTFLELVSTGPGTLLGSGHPDRPTLPSYLGFMRSDDAGRTWQVITRLGEADLHKIVERHDRLYAFDAVLGALLISRDGGNTFTERFTPRGLVIDFVVDPADPARLLAATEDQLHRSEDEGVGWRAIDSGEGIRLAWPAPGTLLRAEKDGTVSRSADGGGRFEEVGTTPGEPYKFKAVDAGHLYLALSDGTIVETRDAGATWKAVFSP